MNFHAKNKLLGQSLIFKITRNSGLEFLNEKFNFDTVWWNAIFLLFGWMSFALTFLNSFWEKKKEMEIRSGILESQRKSKMFTNWKRSTGWPNKIWPYLPVPLVFLVPFMVFWSGFTPYRITQDSSTALGARDCFRG